MSWSWISSKTGGKSEAGVVLKPGPGRCYQYVIVAGGIKYYQANYTLLDQTPLEKG